MYHVDIYIYILYNEYEYVYTYIYIYDYIHMRPACRGRLGLEPRRNPDSDIDTAAHPRGTGRLRAVRPLITDGIGTPDPNPVNLVNWCF